MASDYTARLPFVLAFCCVTLPALLLAQQTKPETKPASTTPSVPDSVDKDYSTELPRLDPLSPPDALRAFEIVPGFRLEQVAAEPLVCDPVAICFDEDCRMFAVEMRGYSENQSEKLSCIRLLDDVDVDGKFDKSTVFADKLNWPTAIHCWKGGVFVADAPDMLYLKDTNGDGVADERKVVLTGFGTSNVQGLVNTFQWSLDNRIVGAISSSGAELRKPDAPGTKPISIRGRDFSFDPETLAIEIISGGAQHGATTDRWGNRFVCSNSDHIQHVVFEDADLANNPLLAAPAVRRSIAADGPQADVFRISPIEPWRIVRTRLRANKIVPGIVEGGGRPAGYFTSATGLTIYSGDAWPAEFLGQAFVGDVGSNIIHRKALKPNGVSFTAERIDQKREFIASRDTWFRPVQFANAPDGCLYICDMYRETIEHPLSIPPILKKHLDLTSGRDRGRIYRVLHETSKQRALPKLSKATTAELALLLDHPNGWHRETAARLIHERGGNDSIRSLEKQFVDGKLPEGRIRAMHSLAQRNALRADLLTWSMQDENPRVREHALKLAKPWMTKSKEISDSVRGLRGDDDPRIQFQYALAMKALPPEQRATELCFVLRSSHFSKRPGEADLTTAILCSLPDGAGLMLEELQGDRDLAATSPGKELIKSLVMQIGKQQRPEDVALLAKTLGRWAEEKSPLLLLAIQSLGAKQGSPLAQQIAKVTNGKADAWLEELLTAAMATAKNSDAPMADRISAIGQFRLGRLPLIQPTIEELLTPAQPAEIQAAAIAVVGRLGVPGAGDILLQRFDQFSPAAKRNAVSALLGDNSLKLLKAIENKTISASDLDPIHWTSLSASRDSEVRTLATKLAANNRPSDRAEILAAYRGSLEQKGDIARGQEVFKKNCAACHKLAGVGLELGPNLAAMKARGPEAILVNVLDPNREVNPQFLNYLLLTSDGRSLSGMLTTETATSVTLKRQDNATDTVLRIDIEQLKSTGQSLMPVGLEKQIDPKAMADLLEYLKSL